MSAPILRSLPAETPLPIRGVASFVVLRAGAFRGQWWEPGDVVVCRGSAHDGDSAVLMPVGRGRPRFGSCEGVTLMGDAGEPCHASRWVAAGKVVARCRQAGDGWVASLLSPVVEESGSASQLSLFAA